MLEALAARSGGAVGAAALDAKFDATKTLTTLRFNRYAAATVDEARAHGNVDHDDADEVVQLLSCESHVDSTLLTMLYVVDRGGLQVLNKSKAWVDVPVVPGAFVVNTGLGAQLLTDGRLNATYHRVKLQPEVRTSIAMFVEFGFNATLDLFSEAPPQSDLAKTWEGQRWGDYMTDANKKYKEYVDR